MRNLKTYKIFEDGNRIFKDIEDVCLELTDDGFQVTYETFQIFTDVNIHFIKIMKPLVVIDGGVASVEFVYRDIEDTVLRLINLLGDRYRYYKFTNDHQYLFQEEDDINKAPPGKITTFSIKWEEQNRNLFKAI